MSVDFRQLSNDPLLQYMSEFKKQQALKLAREQVDQLADSEDIYSDSQDVETKVSFVNTLYTHKFRFNKAYYFPKDPGRMVRAWIRGYNTGATARDFSQYNHRPIIHGEPIIVDGTYDQGTFDESVGVKSIAIRFNRPGVQSAESYEIPDTGDLLTNGIAGGNGFSIFFRFRPFSLSDIGGISRTLWQKVDDSTPNYGHMMQAKDDGRLVFIVKQGGSVVVAKQTNTGVVQVNKIMAGFATYAKTGNVAHIYTWIEPDTGVAPPTVTDQTLSAFGGSVNWESDLTNHSQFIFERGKDSEGYVYGDFYDWELYKADGSFTGIVSAAEAGYRAINKHSISNIGFGQVAQSNHYATFSVAGPASFTSTSFTGTSFNT